MIKARYRAVGKRSNSCIFSSATSDLFCFAKYEISNSLIEMGVI
jgi:hypothetical protein